MNTVRWSSVVRPLVLSACLSGCFVARGSGVTAEEVRETGAFTSVDNTTNLSIIVVDGDVSEVRVTCDDNLLDLVDTEVRNGELRIRTASNTMLRPDGPCVVDLVVPALDRLRASGSGETQATGVFPKLREIESSGSGPLRVEGELGAVSRVDNSGSGSVTVDGFETDDIEIRSSGSGPITVFGVGTFAEVNHSGSGKVEAAELSVTEADIRSSGSGGTALAVTDHVTVRLSGSGSVRIHGAAEIDADDSGSGDVIRE